ncbi:MAG: hypothetical protein M0Q43_05845 [Methanothrix sp.]|jgi:hypothetical protein|nr:hypothetical protein [Methanothrix sp.]
MKSLIATVSILLIVFAAQIFGLAYGTEEAAANDSINATQINETANNTTLTNETLSNETLENTSLAQNESESNPFADAKNRKPSNR